MSDERLTLCQEISEAKEGRAIPCCYGKANRKAGLEECSFLRLYLLQPFRMHPGTVDAQDEWTAGAFQPEIKIISTAEIVYMVYFASLVML